MFTKYDVPAILIGTVVTVLAYQAPSALALSGVEIGKIARDITVRIEGPNDRLGSGTIVRRQGSTYYILTSRHVVDAVGQDYTVYTPDGQQHVIRSDQITISPQVDLALLHFTSENAYRSADFGDSNNLIPGRIVHVAGYASASRNLASSHRVTQGEISTRQETIEGYSLVYSNNTQNGMSGGPVLDELGLLVGIHGLAETEAVYGTRVGLNLGIPLRVFLELNPNLAGETLVLSNSTRTAELISAGDDSLKNRSYGEAFASYNLAVQLSSSSVDAYIGRGIARGEQAAQTYTNSVRLAGDRRAGLDNLQRDLEIALSDFNQALSIDQNSSEAYQARGIVYFTLLDIDSARSDFERAIELDADNGNAYLSMCSMRGSYSFLDGDDYSIAIDDCLKAREIFTTQDKPDRVEDANREIIQLESCRRILSPYRDDSVMTDFDTTNALLRQCLHHISNPIHPDNLIETASFSDYSPADSAFTLQDLAAVTLRRLYNLEQAREASMGFNRRVLQMFGH